MNEDNQNRFQGHFISLYQSFKVYTHIIILNLQVFAVRSAGGSQYSYSLRA
jgi:hypothetical protein